MTSWVSLQFQTDDTSHDGIVDECILNGESGSLQDIAIGLELGGIEASIMLVTRICDGALAAREVLEVDEYTLVVIEIPQQVDLAMHHLTG